MIKCKTTAEVLRRTADMVEMCEGTDTPWISCIKYKGLVYQSLGFTHSPEDYEFAHCLLECKPVFTCDVVYGKTTNHAYVVNDNGNAYSESNILLAKNIRDNCTWTKQTPRKMIEINGDKFPAPDAPYEAGYCIKIYEKHYFYINQKERDAVVTLLQKLMESGK